MARVTLTPRKIPEFMLEGYNISPDAFAGKNAREIADLQGHEGKVVVCLGDYFDVSGSGGRTAEETDILVAGDCSRVKYIGNKMTAGLSQ